jgi:hypothetical protein
MFDVLHEVESELPALLRDEPAWKSVFIDYHPPTVERLWLPWRDVFRMAEPRPVRAR